jgi:SAM-dependent methyltransferase
MTATAPPGEATALKCQCATLWSHPAAQLLLGSALRPGGEALTSHLLAGAALPHGSVVVDVGCGPGTTLEAIAASGHRAIGVDYSHALARVAADAGTSSIVGDAERLPIGDAAVDAVVIECVVSALPDKPRAIDEARRVLRPGGVLLLSDVTLIAPLPEPLNTALAWLACAAGALTVDGYRDLLDTHGFGVTAAEDRSADLDVMIARARRRLALLRGAASVGILPPLEEFLGPELTALSATVLGKSDPHEGGARILAQVSDAVHDKTMGYVAMTAIRR